MQTFVYQARDSKTNKTVKSTVKADTEQEAGRLLLAQGLIPSSIKLADQNSIIKNILNRISSKDKLVFTRQLSTLIGAGLPLAQSLHTVYEQTQNQKLKTVVLDIVTSVESGKTLAESFGKHPKVFDKLYLSLITAGEASGTLDVALQRIANQQEKDAAMMSKIRGALTYPLIVLIVINLVLGFMMFMVVPQVENLYGDMNRTLPVITQVMVGFANFVKSYWWLVIAILGVVIFFFSRYLQTKGGIRFKDGFKLNVPLFKGMFRKLYMARFMRTAALLLDTGVAMLDALAISGEAVNNVLVAESINRAAKRVKGGKALSVSIKDQDYILPLVPQMINIGEQSGQISKLMDKTANVYEGELDEQIKAISTAIEPVLMVILAIVAGAMVGAILLPIYGLVNGVQV